MKRVGVIGLGNMGFGMACNLLAKGFAVRGFDVRPAARQALEQAGGTAAGSAAEAGAGSDAVFLMVLNAAQVMDVLESGLAEQLRPGAAVVITATVGAACVRDARALLAPRGVHVIDAPVSGGKGGAEAGTLTLMAAAPKAVFEANLDVLRAIGGNIYHVGEQAGLGQSVKACLQAMIGASYVALFEAMVMGAKAGIDPDVLATVINSSFVASNLTRNTTALIIDRKFKNSGSHIGTMHKDFGISMDMARELGVPMPVASVAMQMFQAGITAIPDGDNWCIVQLLEKLAATEVKRRTS